MSLEQISFKLPTWVLIHSRTLAPDCELSPQIRRTSVKLHNRDKIIKVNRPTQGRRSTDEQTDCSSITLQRQLCLLFCLRSPADLHIGQRSRRWRRYEIMAWNFISHLGSLYFCLDQYVKRKLNFGSRMRALAFIGSKWVLYHIPN